MTTRTFNVISAIVFGTFAIVLAYAAIYNWVHILLAACSANLFVTAVTDENENGKSLIDEWKQKRAA